MNLRKHLALLILYALVACPLAAAHGGDGASPEPETEPQTLALPFPFYNEKFGGALGFVYGLNGFPEKHSRLIATAFAGTNGAGMLFLAGQDLRLPWLDRLFIDPVFSIGYFDDTKSYINGNPNYPNQMAGSNQSSSNNFINGSGLDSFARSRFKYLLPIGHGREQIVPDYQLNRGLLVSGETGGTSLNPLESGRTFVSVLPFYRNQQIDTDDIDKDEFRTNGLDAAIFWDNRDFERNPSKGQGVRFEISRDFGWFDSSSSWTVLEGEVDQYVNLGNSEWFRQRVLALNFWTANSPSWNKSSSGQISHRPPSYTGATLGGLWRMRGFPTQRFSDQSAIYYSAELRLMPDWNPFDSWPRIQKLVGVDWLQIVPFIEIGRVAPSYDLGNLHSSMQIDGGIGLRAFAKGFVIRADAAASHETFAVQMMISQPFQF